MSRASSLDIARRAKLQQVHALAISNGLRVEEIEPYGNHKAKISLGVLDRYAQRPFSKLICVTAMTPSAQGEGKTCVSIGLTDALALLKKKTMVCLRQPSFAPLMGHKGGGTGGGRSQIGPPEDVNVHFTGDLHAVQSAHNLLAAAIDNHLYRGNRLGLDKAQVQWRRVLDIADRHLRSVQTGLDLPESRRSRSGFDVVASSEVMSALCLATSIGSLRSKLNHLVVGCTREKRAVTARDLQASGAMALLLRDAIKPNLVQTLEGQPALVHGGPFANISLGTSSVLSLQMALKLSNYVVTECGFGTEMGFERFINIVCRQGQFRPQAVVIVVSARGIRSHSPEPESRKLLERYKEGFENLERHIRNVRRLGSEPIVAVNRFPEDTEEEVRSIGDWLRTVGVEHAICDPVGQGGRGCLELAEKVLKGLVDTPAHVKPVYAADLPVEEKIRRIAVELYGADDAVLQGKARSDLDLIKELRLDTLPVVIAKTPYSFSDEPTRKGAPSRWKLKVRGLRVCAGAGYVVALTGKVLLMPGLPEEPLYERFDLADDGSAKGPF
ncbi:MAG: Formate--tetrahydrofolate ligase [Candidatus Omnitrophica bacterium]|nr:Formate--tetrahydrofolate ligase [Candidatus Omnitrophota bacterium]